MQMTDIEKGFCLLLSAFSKHNVLQHLVLIGSWALKVYSENYPVKHFPFKTSDVDFSIKDPRSKTKKTSPSIHEILTARGYTPEFGLISKAEKYIPSPEFFENQLDVDFLCEYGRHIKEPYSINGLGVKVTPVSYQHILLDNTVSLQYKDVFVIVPRPEYWAVHKIAISQKRIGKNAKIKMIKDLEGAGIIVDFLGETHIIKTANLYAGKFNKLFEKGWKIYKEKFGNLLIDTDKDV